jgi:hypothetical protein
LNGVKGEIAVPLFGLSIPPSQTPARSHAKALAADLVYGLTTELIRRTIISGYKMSLKLDS